MYVRQFWDILQNFLASMLDYTVMQMRKIYCEMGYCQPFSNLAATYSQIHVFSNIAKNLKTMVNGQLRKLDYGSLWEMLLTKVPYKDDFKDK